MPNEDILKRIDVGEHGEKVETRVSWGELRRLAQDRRHLFLVALGVRPMVRLFYTDLEHTVFPLQTRNVWTLENRTDSILYEPGGPLDLYEEEDLRCREIIAASVERVRRERERGDA